MELSVLMCSIRPSHARDAIERLRPDLAAFEHEIVVVSPFEVEGPRIVWVREEAPRGSVNAANLGFSALRGRLFLQASDDVAFDRGSVPTAARQLAAMRANDLPCVGFAHRRGAQDYAHAAYGHYVPGFYLAPTDAVRSLGADLYDPQFTAAWADQDLGLRIWAAGGRCEVATAGGVQNFGVGARQPIAAGMNEDNTSREFAAFAAKWTPRQPPYWGNDIRSVAQPVARKLLPLVDAEGLTIAASTPEAALDLRIAAAFTAFGDGAGAPMPLDIARQGQAYLKWVASTGDDPINVVVAARVFALVARMSELMSGGRR